MSKCLHPVTAWKCGTKYTKDGVLSPNIVFSQNEALRYFLSLGLNPEISLEKNQIDFDCGHCINCEAKKRKDYSVRLAHEASMSTEACFITLTYNDESVPRTDLRDWNDPEKQIEYGIDWRPEGFPLQEQTLIPAHLQKFLKRLRRHLEFIPRGCSVSALKNPLSNCDRLFDASGDFVRDHIKDGKHIRYFAVGEYGGKSGRPHYHLIIFGWKPSDMVLHHYNGCHPIYTSSQLEKLWPYGFSTVDNLTLGRAQYCARYVTKKFARLSQEKTDYLCPEFVLASKRNGGIGASWFDKFGVDSCVRGFCNVGAGDRIFKASIPAYYWSRLRKTHLAVWLDCREHRLEFIANCKAITHEERLRAADFVAETLSREKSLEKI